MSRKGVMVVRLFAVSLALGTAFFAFATGVFDSPRAGSLDQVHKAPEFTNKSPQQWINSPPLTWNDLRGKVVLLDFWTFDCWNCYRSFPWLKKVEADYEERGLQVVGVHAPEFDHEKIRSNVVEKVREFGLHHPVMIDNDFSYWRAMNNRYWPAFYLIDRRGFVRSAFFGETHSGDARAVRIEKAIERLLAEEA